MVRKNAPWQVSEGAWYCQHLYFRLLACSTLRQNFMLLKALVSSGKPRKLTQYIRPKVSQQCKYLPSLVLVPSWLLSDCGVSLCHLPLLLTAVCFVPNLTTVSSINILNLGVSYLHGFTSVSPMLPIRMVA